MASMAASSSSDDDEIAVAAYTASREALMAHMTASSSDDDDDDDIVVAYSASRAALLASMPASSSDDDDEIVVAACASDDDDDAAPSPLASPAAVRSAARRAAGRLGYAVLDGALAADAFDAVAAAVRGAPYAAYAYTTARGDVAEDAAISEVLVDEEKYAALAAVRGALAAAARAAAPSLALDGHAVVKLQRNRGGAFPAHYDNGGRPSRRGLTAILYASAAGPRSDGGRLVLRPFLRRPRVVAPRANRLVFLRSDRVLHEVTPWRGCLPRFAASLWFRTTVDEDDTGDLVFDGAAAAAAFLATSPRQRQFAAALYGDAMAAAARAAVPDEAALAGLLATYAGQAARAEAALGPAVLADLRAFRARSEARGAVDSDGSSDASSDDAPWESVE